VLNRNISAAGIVGQHARARTTHAADVLVGCRLGYKVALLDADVGLRNLDLLLGLENRVLYTAIDILEGDCRCGASAITSRMQTVFPSSLSSVHQTAISHSPCFLPVVAHSPQTVLCVCVSLVCRLDQALIRDKRWKNLSLLSISRNRQR
jgi:septum formation inhibitor-activating ATPase MinD